MGNYTPEQVEAMVRNLEVVNASTVQPELKDMLRYLAATLRQQAGRVDEGMVERAREAYFNAASVEDGVFTDPVAMRAALTAALAQNTQGEAVADAIYDPEGLRDKLIELFYRERASEDDAVLADQVIALLPDLPAERARVPERNGPIALFTNEEAHEAYRCLRTHNHSIPDACLDQMRDVLLAAVDDDYDAAAPSQRAEVK